MINKILIKEKNNSRFLYFLLNFACRKQYKSQMNQNYTHELVDMICFHSECVKKQQQLFRYNLEKEHHSKHLLSSCSILHIHNLYKLESYQQKMISQLTLGFDQQFLNQLEVKLEQLKVNVSQRYIQYSHQLYQNFIRNCPKLLNQQMLTMIKNSNNPTQEVNLINTLHAEKQAISKKLISSILQPIFQQLKKEMLEVTIRIQNMIEQTSYVFVDDKKYQTQMEPKNDRVMKNFDYGIKSQSVYKSKEIPRKSKPISKAVTKQLYQSKPNDRDHEDYEVKFKISPNRRNIYENLARSKKGKFMKKNKKQIMNDAKSDRLMILNQINEKITKKQLQIHQKKVSQNSVILSAQIREEEANHQESSININQDLDQSINQQSIHDQEQQIQREDQYELNSEQSPNFMRISTQRVDVRQDQVIINSQADVQKTLNLANAIQSQKIVIFYQISEELLITLINKLKPRKVTLNCKITITKKFNYLVEPKILKNIEFFEQHWDHNIYFFQIAKSKHFPTYHLSYKQPSKKNHFKAYFLSKLKRIKNIWISSPKDLVQLQKSKLNIKNIQYLRLQPCICCKNNSFFADSVEYFKDVTSLKTIIVKRCNIYIQNRRALRDLLRRNDKLECIFLENNLKIEFYYLSILQKLKITKLAVINESSSHISLRCDDIFTLHNLKYLYLNSIQINEINNYQTDPIQSSDLELIANFKKLQKLTFLDLYNSDIYPQFITFLHPNVYKQLTYLNLGYNVIDNSVTIPYLRRFQSITYLQLDGTSLDLSTFFSQEKNKYRINETIKYLSLRWFTGNQNEIDPRFKSTVYHPLTQRNFELLVQNFPKVEYLNISDSVDVIGQVHFKDLVYLKDLCVDQRYTNMKQFVENMNKLQISVFKRKSIEYIT